MSKKDLTDKRFILMGDIAHPSRISVIAKSLEDALVNVAKGDFSVYDEQNDCLSFDWNGDEDSVEVE